MREEFLQTIKFTNKKTGVTTERTVVLYAGLLDAAHAAGLAEIITEIVQLPTEANKHVAVARAVVTMRVRKALGRTVTSGGEEVEQRFSGIADSSPANTESYLLKFQIELAETRAKARALRDAVNIGTVALEELDVAGDGTVDNTGADQPDEAATQVQKSAIVKMLTRLERPVVLEKIDGLTRAQASEAITSLSDQLHAKK